MFVNGYIRCDVKIEMRARAIKNRRKMVNMVFMVLINKKNPNKAIRAKGNNE